MREYGPGRTETAVDRVNGAIRVRSGFGTVAGTLPAAGLSGSLIVAAIFEDL